MASRKRKAQVTESLFGFALTDYVHNLLVRPYGHWARRLEDNALVLDVLGRHHPYPRPGQFWNAIQRYIASNSAPRSISRPVEPVAANLDRLGEIFSLTEVDGAVLQLALAVSDSAALQEAVWPAIGRLGTTAFARVAGIMVGHSHQDVARALASSGRIAGCGLLQLSQTGDLQERLSPREGLLEVLESPGLDRRLLLDRFLPNVAHGPAAWLEHGHLETEISAAKSLLAAALRVRASGVNVLLYGESGTGKTELAKSLARGLGVPLYAAQRGETSLKPADRLGALGLGLRVVEAGNAIVLFDELDDLFDGSIANLLMGHTSAITGKDSFNRMLETNPAPVIWTTNDVRSVDRAFLRRFSHAVHVRPGGIRQRARILKHHLELPLDLVDPRLDGLAESYAASPAQVSAAVHAARLLGEPSADRIATFLDGTCRLTTGRSVQRSVTDADIYLVDAINASIDLRALADRLSSWTSGDAPGVTMCLYGQPGTGKSEYVRYLARRLGRSVIVKRASDLLGKYVGDTEHQIASAFEQASSDDSILVFDEVDSLLQDRRQAFRTWEVTSVNEMLQQLEAFRGIVACTTNRWDGLDPAVLRRFTFKIELRPPTPDQAVSLFWAMFEPVLRDSDPADKEIVRDAVAKLRPTPGDLSAVRRRVLALGARRSASELLDEVRAETGQRGQQAAGFAANRTV